MTHLGVPAGNIVLLEAIGVKDSPDLRERFAFFRTMPTDGTRVGGSGSFGFTAPPNRAFILTEVDWQFESGVANGTVTLRVFLTWPDPAGGPGSDRRVLESTTLLGSQGGGGTSTVAATGVVVPHGVKITVDVVGSGATGRLQHVLMRGYITEFDQGLIHGSLIDEAIDR